MSESPIRNDVASFCTMFTRAIIAWNNAEDAIKNILEGLSEGSLGATIAIRQLGNASLKEAILVVSSFLDSEEAEEAKERSEHLKHLVEGFDILRVYRNFYVHNIRAMGSSPGPDPQFTGTLHTLEVKGRYAWVQQDLTMPELRNFTQSVLELSQYAFDVGETIKPRNALGPLIGNHPKPLASLQKPTWPAKLKKNLQNLIEREPPPQPSRA